VRRFGLLMALMALITATPAHATFPGKNGKIAYSGAGPSDCGIFVVNPDGSAELARHEVRTSTDAARRAGTFIGVPRLAARRRRFGAAYVDAAPPHSDHCWQ